MSFTLHVLQGSAVTHTRPHGIPDDEFYYNFSAESNNGIWQSYGQEYDDPYLFTIEESAQEQHNHDKAAFAPV